MGRQARIKRERSKARQAQALPVVDEWRDIPDPMNSGKVVRVRATNRDFIDEINREGGPVYTGSALVTSSDSVSAPTDPDNNFGSLYALTAAPTPSNSRTDDPARRADEAAARARAQGVTVFPADPRRTQAEAKMVAALALFVGSGLDLRNPPQRRSIPRPPDGRFTPKRPR